MALSDLAAAVSVISGIAIVFSLIFLALQVRQANRNQRSLMQQARTGRNVAILLKMADGAIGETIAKATRNCAGLSDAQTWSFYGFAAAVFWSYEDSFMQFEAGTLDASSWKSDVATLKRLIAHPPYRVVWKMARDGMSGNYRDYIDSLMNEVPTGPLRNMTDQFRIYIAEEMPST